MHQICSDEGIVVLYFDLTRSGRVMGLYFRTECGEPAIALDNKLKENVRLHRSVFAEEIGHYFTVPTGSVIGVHFAAAPPLNGQARLRDEAKAVKWAANHLIPTAELADAIRCGLHTVHDLAEHFQVTEWMVYRKFSLLRTDLREQHRLRVRGKDLFSPILVNAHWGEKTSAATS